jgi:hypothetical protein
MTDSFTVRAGYGMTWIEQARHRRRSTPFVLYSNRRPAVARQYQSCFRAFAGPSVRVSEPNPDSGLGQGVFAVEREQGGYARQWNLVAKPSNNWSTEIGYLGSADEPRSPRCQHEPADA